VKPESSLAELFDESAKNELVATGDPKTPTSGDMPPLTPDVFHAKERRFEPDELGVRDGVNRRVRGLLGFCEKVVSGRPPQARAFRGYALRPSRFGFARPYDRRRPPQMLGSSRRVRDDGCVRRPEERADEERRNVRRDQLRRRRTGRMAPGVASCRVCDLLPEELVKTS
jgi:hypothetical protein